MLENKTIKYNLNKGHTVKTQYWCVIAISDTKLTMPTSLVTPSPYLMLEFATWRYNKKKTYKISRQKKSGKSFLKPSECD